MPVSRGGDTAAYALLDFVYASYPGRAKPEELQRSKGLTPDELGKRLVAWCKELVKKG